MARVRREGRSEESIGGRQPREEIDEKPSELRMAQQDLERPPGRRASANSGTATRSAAAVARFASRLESYRHSAEAAQAAATRRNRHRFRTVANFARRARLRTRSAAGSSAQEDRARSVRRGVPARPAIALRKHKRVHCDAGWWTRLQPIRTVSEIDVEFVVFTTERFQFQRIGDEARRMRRLGMSLRAIGAAFGVDEKTVRKALRRQVT